MPSARPRPQAAPAGVSLARALSKLGAGSRRDAERWVADGRVRVNGRPTRDARTRVDPRRDRLTVDGSPVRARAREYLALHKPRGVLTSHVSERGAPTVYDVLAAARPAAADARLIAVGRLDKASEGLLLFTNDTRWASRVLDPAAHVPKRYHVHVDAVPDAALLDALRRGAAPADGLDAWLRVRDARVLRAGARTGWLDLELDEGRNRHIRRLLGALGVEVKRLIRVAVGPVVLGGLAAGAVRALTPDERRALGAPLGALLGTRPPDAPLGTRPRRTTPDHPDRPS